MPPNREQRNRKKSPKHAQNAHPEPRSPWQLFRFGHRGAALYPPRATFGPRTLQDYELAWVTEGDAVWQVDGERHEAGAGSVVLCRPGMVDAIRWDEWRSSRHGFVHFDIDPRALAALPSPSEWPIVRQLDDGDIIGPLLEHLEWLFGAEPPDWGELAQVTMFHILLSFISGSTKRSAEPPVDEPRFVERVVRHIERRWSSGQLVAISLEELAGAAHVSRAHLVRLFRRELGVTPARALRTLRLERAAQLVGLTNMRFKEIAELTGFATPFHFSRAFRAAYASSPRAFRARIAAGGDMPSHRLTRVRSFAARVWPT